MKILHINSYYNGSSFYKNLYDQQQKNLLDISVYVPISTSTDISTLQLGNYTTISKNHNKYDRLFFHLKHKKIYEDLLKKYELGKIDIVHAHSLFSNGYMALRLKKDYNIPYIVAVRNTDVNIFFKYMVHLRKLGLEILTQAKKIIFISPSYREFLIEKYIPDSLKDHIRDKSAVIPNGVEDFWLKNKDNSNKSLNKNYFKILYIGAINQNKNILTTLKALELLKEEGYKVHFTAVGKILDKSVYHKMMSFKEISYIKHCSKEELIKIYRKNDIFVMPSRTETFGIVYAEALTQGLPVIYTRNQGFDGQFTEGEVGYSVNPMDPEEIKEKLIKIRNHYGEISQRGLELVDRFKWDKITKEYEKIYINI